MSLLEGRTNAELKKSNYSKIVAGGLPFVRNPQFGFNSASVGQLTFANGSIIKDPLLTFDLGQDLGAITLKDEDRSISEFKYYAEPAENGILLLKVLINTYKGEGSGFGNALFYLGDTMVGNLAPHFRGYKAVYAEGEDSAKKRFTLNKRAGWTTSMMQTYGYTDNSDLLKQLGLSTQSKKMFLKKLT